ncbi:hypothetical protein VTK73DRAFT_3638 [Phialemonium thermophilum]|uniref:Uncharacterized protein n=1 Tax=Phialemonium thermophilum TaxID=223376 RepID=A0ABR3VHK1_9PEZI
MGRLRQVYKTGTKQDYNLFPHPSDLYVTLDGGQHKSIDFLLLVSLIRPWTGTSLSSPVTQQQHVSQNDHLFLCQGRAPLALRVQCRPPFQKPGIPKQRHRAARQESGRCVIHVIQHGSSECRFRRSSDDGLQLAGVAEGILDDGPAELLVLLQRGGGGGALLGVALGGVGRAGDGGDGGGEVDLAVADDPAALLGELDDGALGVEEEEGLGGGEREGGVGALAAAGDLGADLGGEDLRGVNKL